MRRLMAAADLLVGKAGGLTSAECLAVGLPMVVLDPIAGQEQANADFLTRAGAAVPAGEPEGLAAVVAPLLQPARLAELRRAAADLGRPDAGKRVLEAVLA
jgi:processive 1,2-diacylglycerol beta-glucosyltransferase